MKTAATRVREADNINVLKKLASDLISGFANTNPETRCHPSSLRLNKRVLDEFQCDLIITAYPVRVGSKMPSATGANRRTVSVCGDIASVPIGESASKKRGGFAMARPVVQACLAKSSPHHAQ